ncbi:MAG: tripartite tricarboxylate transporter substrate binding protein [Alphaproteobacteria bacterium]
MDRRQFLAAPLVLTSLQGRPALAQTYPSRPITFLVAHGAGSSTDVVARLVAEHLPAALGQPVVVEARPGAGGNIASVAVKNAAPDGHTILVNSVSIAVNPSLYANAGYDPIRELTSIALGPRTPNIFTVNPRVPVTSVPELIAYMKANAVNYASSGTGTTTHLSMERFKRAAGVEAVHVPYTPARAVTDVIGGHVPIGSTSMPVAVPQVRGGHLRAIAVTSRTRSPALPDVPTLAELGYPQFDDYTWFGFHGPAGLPRPIHERLNSEINKVLKLPSTLARLNELGFEAATFSIDEFTGFVQSEVTKWREVIVANQIKPD